jgi:hypothetical protein
MTGNATNGIVVANAADLFPPNIFIRGCDASWYASYGAAIYVKPGKTACAPFSCNY